MADQNIKLYKTLREFLDDAHHNTKVTEQNQNFLFNKIDAVHKTFTDLIGFLDYSKQWFLVFFVLRAHSSFLAAATLATSTQLPNSYGAMRSVLENTIYGFYIWRHQELIKPWLLRQENEESRQKVRNEFKHGKMISELKCVNSNLGNIYDTLYNDTIDYGAHPNVASVITNLEQIEESDTITHVLKYFNSESPYIDLVLKHLSRIGLLSLKIFGIIWYHRLKLTDIIGHLDELGKGL